MMKPFPYKKTFITYKGFVMSYADVVGGKMWHVSDTQKRWLFYDHTIKGAKETINKLLSHGNEHLKECVRYCV